MFSIRSQSEKSDEPRQKSRHLCQLVQDSPDSALKGMQDEANHTTKEVSASGTAKAADETVDYFDQDITDQDILKGLKMVLSAACDEKLDRRIRAKTGVRLRRFLADLRAFEDLELEQASCKSTDKLTKHTSLKERRSVAKDIRKQQPVFNKENLADVAYKPR